ncbi:MAG TPA: dephospho-CoA kinase [Candidatus Dormibacteraeota bacterium]|nr:dephospho-CoA kinase [Candidatus Dormibacteraeota bacterium]
MKVVGLTGGIGTGKSAVSAILRRMGATVIDADEATRAVQARGTEGLRLLVEAFGPGILTPDGDLDRARLAAVAFADPDARARLNAIVHPLVRQWMAERQQEAVERGDPVVVLDIPLLFEARGAGAFETVLLVYAPESVQLDRLVRLRGMTGEQARARIAAQLPIEEKRRLATHVIENTGSLDDLEREVARVWADLRLEDHQPHEDAQTEHADQGDHVRPPGVEHGGQLGG